MAAVHIAGDGHATPASVAGRDGILRQWLVYPEVKKKKVVDDALFILRHNVRGSRPCNNCFSKLPRGRTFDDILDDATVFISYDPDNSGRFGTTLGNDITITEFSVRMGRWTVAATLVHEFGHINGAPGNTHEAEGTLPCCGFAALHDPTIIGSIGGSSNTRYA
jgi:hypothetical protein